MMAWATWRGGSLACLARIRARLVARSPCSACLAASTSKAGMVSKASWPEALARSALAVIRSRMVFLMCIYTQLSQFSPRSQALAWKRGYIQSSRFGFFFLL